MENKFAESAIETAINDYQRKHPEEDNLKVIMISEKNIFGRMESNMIVGTKDDWRGILENIRKKRETFVYVEIASGEKEEIETLIGVMQIIERCEKKVEGENNNEE